MSNSYAGANCAVVTGFNGNPFLLTKPLHYVNPFFLENGTIAKKVTFFARMAAFPGNNGWGLVINGNCNGREWKPHQKRVQRPFLFH